MTTLTSIEEANGGRPTRPVGSRETTTLLHLADETPRSSCHFEMGADEDVRNNCGMDQSSSALGDGAHKILSTGTSESSEVAANIFVSFVGAGWLLVLPHAFSKSGWLLGTWCLALVSTINVYSMLLLVKCRKRLESRGHRDIKGYGDLGRVVMGRKGEVLVNVCLLILQMGFATAYLSFVADNIQRGTRQELSRAAIIYGCVPILSLLVQIRDMKYLSTFSTVANICNLMGLASVIFKSFEDYSHDDIIVAADTKGLIYVTSVCIFSLEGVSLILPLESSCANREEFPKILMQVILAITMLMSFFGTCGYVAYGDSTATPISSNLAGESAIFVMWLLCFAIYLTYPIMMFPVNSVLEKLILSDCNMPPRSYYPSMIFRLCIVVLTANIAYLVPDFGKLLQLVGASICTLLGYTLPCVFHFKVFGSSEMKLWEMMLNVCIIIFAFMFGTLCTLDAIFKIFGDEESNAEVSEAVKTLATLIGIFGVVALFYNCSMKACAKGGSVRKE